MDIEAWKPVLASVCEHKRLVYFLACHCSQADWFQTHFFGNLEDRFCRDKGHMINNKQFQTKNRHLKTYNSKSHWLV